MVTLYYLTPSSIHSEMNIFTVHRKSLSQKLIRQAAFLKYASNQWDPFYNHYQRLYSLIEYPQPKMSNYSQLQFNIHSTEN